MSIDVLYYAIFAVAAAWAIYRVVKSDTLTGTLFGTPVQRKTAEIDAEGQGMYDVELAVHVLDPEDARRGPHVGVMVSLSSVMSLRKTPIGLTRSQARRLARELTRAVEESADGG